MHREEYDHKKSKTVDVRENSDGEFVQVWDAPFKTPGRRLLLTYQRNGEAVSDVTRFEYPEDGEFASIHVSENYKYSFYRDNPRVHRLEQDLDNGLTLIDDELNGFETESIFTVNFNFETMQPKGRKLGDRAVMKLQTENQEYYVSTYQVSPDRERQLARIRKYLGRDVVETKLYEFN